MEQEQEEGEKKEAPVRVERDFDALMAGASPEAAKIFWDYTKQALLPDPYRRAQLAHGARLLGRSLAFDDNEVTPETIEFAKNSPPGTWAQERLRGAEDIPLTPVVREKLLQSIPEDFRDRFLSFDKPWEFSSMSSALEEEQKWQRYLQSAPLSETIPGSFWQFYLELFVLRKITGGASLVSKLRPVGWSGQAAKAFARGAELGVEFAAWDSLIHPSAYPYDRFPGRALKMAVHFGTFHVAAFFLAPITRLLIQNFKRTDLYNRWLWKRGKPAAFAYGYEPKEFTELRSAGKVAEHIPLSKDLSVEHIPEEFEAVAVSPEGKYRYVAKYKGKGPPQPKLIPDLAEEPLVSESAPPSPPPVPPSAAENPAAFRASIEKRTQDIISKDTDHPERLSQLLDLFDEAQQAPEEAIGFSTNPSEAFPSLASAVLAESYASNLSNDFPSYRLEITRITETGGGDPETRGIIVTEVQVVAGKELRRELPANPILRGVVDNKVTRFLDSAQGICMQSEFYVMNVLGQRLFYNNFQANKAASISNVPSVESVKDEAERELASYARSSDQCFKASELSIDDYETELYYASNHHDKAREDLSAKAASAVERDAKLQREIMDADLDESMEVGVNGLVLLDGNFSYRSRLYVREKVDAHASDFDDVLYSYFRGSNIPPSKIKDLVAGIHLKITGLGSDITNLTDPGVFFNVDSYIERLDPRLKRRVLDLDPMVVEPFVEKNPVKLVRAVHVSRKIYNAMARMRNDIETEDMINRWEDKLAAVKSGKLYSRFKKKNRVAIELWITEVIKELKSLNLGKSKGQFLAKNSMMRLAIHPVKELEKRLRPQDFALFQQLQERFAQDNWETDILQQSPRTLKQSKKTLLLTDEDKEILESLQDSEPTYSPQMELDLGEPETQKMEHEVEERWRVDAEQTALPGIGVREQFISREKGASIFSSIPSNLSSAEIAKQFPVYGNQLHGGYIWTKRLQERADWIFEETGLDVMSHIGLPRFRRLNDMLYADYSTKREELHSKLSGTKLDTALNRIEKNYDRNTKLLNQIESIMLGTYGAPKTQDERSIDEFINNARALAMMEKLPNALVSVFVESYNSVARFGLIKFTCSLAQRAFSKIGFSSQELKDRIAFLRDIDGMALAIESAQSKVERYFGGIKYHLSHKEYKELFKDIGNRLYDITLLPLASDFFRSVAWPLLEREWARAFRENDKAYLSRNGVDSHWEPILREQVEKFGTKNALNFHLWTNPQAIRRFRDLLRAQQNTLVMMPSVGVVPLIFKGPIAKLFMQFKRIMFSSLRMVLMPLLAEGKYSTIMLLAWWGAVVGTFVYYLKWLGTGANKREDFLSYKNIRAIASKQDLFAVPFTFYEAAEAFFKRGDIHDSVSMPALSMIQDAYRLAKTTVKGELFTQKGLRQFKQFVPIANHILADRLWQELGLYSDLEVNYLTGKSTRGGSASGRKSSHRNSRKRPSRPHRPHRNH
jgi:hypothetical protein